MHREATVCNRLQPGKTALVAVHRSIKKTIFGNNKIMNKLLLGVIAIAIAGVIYWKTRPSPFNTNDPLIAGSGAVELLADLNTQELSPGWVHRKFLTVSPADYQTVEEDGVSALRCVTDNSGSILARDTSIPLSTHPILSWRWKVTEPIDSDIDEATKDGDDHPIRFFLVFSNENKDRRAMEIIWSNKKYIPGDYKIIGNFYHYVANGLEENTGKWFDQQVDLRKIYSDIGGTGTPTLETIGFFCDSDNTGTSSDGMFSRVVLSPGG